MNFTFLPSSSLLIHSSSGICVAPGASSHTMVSRQADGVSVNRGVCQSRLLPVASKRLGHSAGADCAFDASVGSKFLVTFGFVFPLHFIERAVSEGT